MKKNNVTSKINDLLDFEKSVEKIYNSLASLELEGKQNTQEYDELIDLINSVIELSNDKYKSLGSFENEEFKNYDLLIQSLNHCTEDELIDVLLFGKENHIKRFYSHIQDIKLRRTETFKEDEKTVDDNIRYSIYIEAEGRRILITKKQAEEMGLDAKEIIKQVFKEEMDMKKRDEERRTESNKIISDAIYYRKSLINAYFYEYLIRYIETCKNKSVKNALIKYKYKLIYMTPSLERAFAKNKSSNIPIYEDLINLGVTTYPTLYEIAYLQPLAQQIKDYFYRIANEENKDDKIHKILNALYTKAQLAAVYDDVALETLKLLENFVDKDVESKEDAKYAHEAFKTEESLRIPILSRKKVD